MLCSKKHCFWETNIFQDLARAKVSLILNCQVKFWSQGHRSCQFDLLWCIYCNLFQKPLTKNNAANTVLNVFLVTPRTFCSVYCYFYAPSSTSRLIAFSFFLVVLFINWHQASWQSRMVGYQKELVVSGKGGDNLWPLEHVATMLTSKWRSFLVMYEVWSTSL